MAAGIGIEPHSPHDRGEFVIPTDTIIALEKALEAYDSATNGREEAIAMGALMNAISPDGLRGLFDAHASALRDAERLREALKRIAAIEDRYSGTDWQEIEDAREIARAALDDNTKGAAE
jgi:hypothetical protein